MKGIVFVKNDKYSLPAWFIEHEGSHYLLVNDDGDLATAKDGICIGRDENKCVEFEIVKRELDVSGTHVGLATLRGKL